MCLARRAGSSGGENALCGESHSDAALESAAASPGQSGFSNRKKKKQTKNNIKKENPSLQTYLKRSRYDYFICWLQPSSLLAKVP